MNATDQLYDYCSCGASPQPEGLLSVQRAGRDGWELLDYATLPLSFRRPRDRRHRVRWEYTLLIGIVDSSVFQTMRMQGWEPVGSSSLIRCFKRPG